MKNLKSNTPQTNETAAFEAATWPLIMLKNVTVLNHRLTYELLKSNTENKETEMGTAALESAMVELTKNLSGSWPLILLKNGMVLNHRLMYDKLAKLLSVMGKVEIDFLGTEDVGIETATDGVKRAKSFANSVKLAMSRRGIEADVHRRDATVVLWCSRA